MYAVWGYDSDNDGTADVLGENYVIRSYAGPNGSIDPSGDTTVAEGGDKALPLFPTPAMRWIRSSLTVTRI